MCLFYFFFFFLFFLLFCFFFFFFFSSRRRHTRLQGDWSSDVCSSDLGGAPRRRGSADGSAQSSRARAGTGRLWAEIARPRVSRLHRSRSLQAPQRHARPSRG